MSRSSPVRSLRSALDAWPSPGSFRSLGLLLVGMSLALKGGRLAAQIVPLAPGSGVIVYSAPSVDPSRLPNTGPYAASFWVVNQRVSAESFSFWCTTSGPISCDNVNPAYGSLNPGDSVSVSLTYSTLGTTGPAAVGLVAERDLDSDTGWRDVGVYNAGKGGIAFLSRIVDNLDRGLCLTIGAGESAGLSCGDLSVVQGMPAYRTLGKDRSLTLHYNSATATGLTLVPGRVTEPATIAMPSAVRVILTVNGTLKDSVTYTPPTGYNCGVVACSDTFQVVLGRNLNWASLPTGYYPATLTLRNLYPALYDSVVAGNILVVNRSASEYGRGWALLGVEQLLTDPADSTRRIWVAGDGSARVYHRGAWVTSTMLSQLGLGGFSAANSIDGNLTNTAWTTSSSTATTSYVRADLGATFAQAVTSARLYAATGTNATYDVQYSSNGSTWTTVLAGFKPQAGWSSVAWSTVGAYRYWRLKVAANNGASSTIRELSFGASNNYYGAPGDAPDSLVRFDTLGTKWYRRPLRHGASVTLDNTGRHRLTTNRVGHRTLFSWTTVASQTRLGTITVPPNDATPRNFLLGWNPTTALLETMTDPGGRQLRTSITGGNLSKIVLPGKLDSTRFGYDARNVLVKRIASRQPGTTRGDSAYTVYSYGNGARVTAVAIQADSAGTAFTTSAITPWDERGFAALVESDTAVNGLSTRIDGPIPGTGDVVDFAVDRYGQPMRIRHVGLGTLTVMTRDSSKSLPALLTKVQYPHPTSGAATGRIVRLSWNARGNLVEQRDSTSHLGTAGLPTKALKLTYGDNNSPDAPTRAEDALGRKTDYAYHTILGLTDSVIDPRGHATKYFFKTSGVLAGVLDSVAERRVATWVQGSGTDVVQDQTNRFTYDANGNIERATSPAGALTSYVLDNLGRITSVYDPLGTRNLYAYDSLNRITTATFHTAKQAHPGGVNPLAGVSLTQFDTTDATQPFLPALPGTLLTRYALTPQGLLDSVLDPANVKRKFRYDAMNRIRQEIDDSGRSKVFYYSASTGLLDSLQMRHGSVIRYEYDASGRRVRIIYPSRVIPQVVPGGPVATTVPGDTIAFAYDLLGNVVRATNRVTTGLVGGQLGTIRRSYFADGSVKTKSSRLPNMEDSLTYQYDAAGARTKLVMTALGSSGWTDSVSYTYNTSGDLATTQVCWGVLGAYTGGCKPFSFAWDSLGRRRKVVYPSNNMQVVYYYDALGTLRRVASTNGSGLDGNRFAFNFDGEVVDPTGRIRRHRMTCFSAITNPAEKLGYPCRDGAPAQVDSNQYNRRGEVVLQLDDAGSYDSLQYDIGGNRSRRHQFRAAVLQHTIDSFFVAPASHRLSRNHRIQPSDFSLNYVYDADGARLAQLSNPLEQSTVDDEHYWYYDALGRQRGYRYVEWISNGAVFRDAPLDCAYDPDGQPYYPCQQGAPPQAFDGSNVTRVGGLGPWRFVHGPGVDDPLIGRIAWGSGTWRELYFVTDGEGRRLSIAEPNGTFYVSPWTNIDYRDYKWVGVATNGFSFNVDRQSSANQPEISLFRNRSYDSRSGRWLQEDPIGIAGGINLYQFNGNNPVAYADPFGLCPPCAAVVAAAYALYEFGSAAYDVYQAGKTLLDKNASPGQKTLIVGLAAASVFGPGGGYTAAEKGITKALGEGAGLIGRAGRGRGVREVVGSSEDATALFGRLTEGATVKAHPKVEGGLIAELPGGGTVGYRPTSKSGGPAIDINVPGSPVNKIHYVTE